MITLQIEDSTFWKLPYGLLSIFQLNAKNKIQLCSLLRHQQITQNVFYSKINDVTNMPAYSRLKQDYLPIWCQFVINLQRYDTISAHVPKRILQFVSEKS